MSVLLEEKEKRMYPMSPVIVSSAPVPPVAIVPVTVSVVLPVIVSSSDYSVASSVNFVPACIEPTQ